jgi:8-oxo-dGTP pyrophosphatase MutT (NUDIX family)
MRKIVCIAIKHPALPNLFLHGLRRDNHRWSLAGGHSKPGETDLEAANRELKEETGLENVKIDKIHDRVYGDNHVVLYSGDRPDGVDPRSDADPDKEFVTFKFLDPTSHANLHVPAERNVLVDWMNSTLAKKEHNRGYEEETEKIRENKKLPAAHVSHEFKAARWTFPNGHPRCIVCGQEEPVSGTCEALDKSRSKITVEPFLADPENFNPRKHDFIVRAHRAGKQVGFLAVTHKPEGIMPFNFEVGKLHQRKGYGTALATHAQKISGKKIVRSPDMTQAGASFADKFIKTPRPIAKTEIIHNEDTSSLMNRIETKHFMPKENLDKLLAGIKGELPDGDPDTSVRFNVNKTIYLDNPDLDALRDNMESHKPRFKVRIRQYSPNGKEWEDVAYVELKLKTKDGQTKKIRVRVPESMIDSVCHGKPMKIDESLEKLNLDIPKDILWKRVVSINTILEKYGFKKQITVTYQRRAFSNEDIRVTIDDSIRYSDARELAPDSISMIKDSSYWKGFKKRHLAIRNQDFVIVEVKEETGVPKWLRKILDSCDAEEVRFSKYCGAMVSFLKSGGKSDGPITRNRKIDANSVLSQIDGYEVFGKTEELMDKAQLPLAVQPPITLVYPATVNGKKTSMKIKDFGEANSADISSIHKLISANRFHEPVAERKLVFSPHKLKRLDGSEQHVLLVHGVPDRVSALREQSHGIGKDDQSPPHIVIDADEYDKLSRIGQSLTAREAGIRLHPAELRYGTSVLKTY